MRIARVRVDGDPLRGNFAIDVLGDNLTGVDYALGDEQGRVMAVRVELFDDDHRTAYQAHEVISLGLDQLRANVPVALGRGTYGVRVFKADSGFAERAKAFQVLEPDPWGGGGEDPGDSNDDGVIDDDDMPQVIEPFIGDFRFRRKVELTTTSLTPIPAGTTFLIVIPHAQWMFGGSSATDAGDIALYHEGQRLPHAWLDRTMIGSDALTLVARLPVDLAPITGLPGSLFLYYGSTGPLIPTSNAVFDFFSTLSQNPAGWRLGQWRLCNFDRETDIRSSGLGALCVDDGPDYPTSFALSSPTMSSMRRSITNNQVYEVTFWLRGNMLNEHDLFHFGISAGGASADSAMGLADTSYLDYPPNGSLDLTTPTTGHGPVVRGWRFNTTAQPWTRVRARFATPIDRPSLHFRFLSVDALDFPDTLVVLDELTVRLAAEDEIYGRLSSEEAR